MPPWWLRNLRWWALSICNPKHQELYSKKQVIACILWGKKRRFHSKPRCIVGLDSFIYFGGILGFGDLSQFVSCTRGMKLRSQEKIVCALLLFKVIKNNFQQLLQLECSLQQRASNYNVKMMMMTALWVPSSCFESCVLASCIDFLLKFLPGQGFSNLTSLSIQWVLGPKEK